MHQPLTSIPLALALALSLAACDSAATAGDAGPPALPRADAGPPLALDDAGPPAAMGSDAGAPPMTLGDAGGPAPTPDAGPPPATRPDAGPGSGGTFLCCVDGAQFDCVDRDTLLACVRGDSSGCTSNGRCD